MQCYANRVKKGWVDAWPILFLVWESYFHSFFESVDCLRNCLWQWPMRQFIEWFESFINSVNRLLGDQNIG